MKTCTLTRYRKKGRALRALSLHARRNITNPAAAPKSVIFCSSCSAHHLSTVGA